MISKRVLALSLGVFALVLTVSGAKQRKNDGIYPETVAVVDMKENLGGLYTVTGRTMTGNEFSFYSDSSDWMRRDIVSLILDNNGTPEVEDDQILGAKYSGYGDPANW